MDKNCLRMTLIEEKFNPKSYSLENEEKDEALCLRLEDEGWCIYYSERGLQTGKQCFSDEKSACEYFLNEMRSDPTTKADWKSGFSM
jgi:hypothetical protein